MILTTIFLVITLAYLCFTLALLYFWFKIVPFVSNKNHHHLVLSVVIPVRDEERNITRLLEDLEAQTYPQNLMEILVVDDASTDHTARMVQQFAAGSKCSIKLLSLHADPSMSSKKQAISMAVSHASGDWIFATDGDCRVGKNWVQTIANYQAQTGAKFIFGGVSFHEEGSLFEHLQTIEFAALTGSGAASFQGDFPTMCNGANLAYERKIFELVNGFEGNNHIPSGDDEFLMHKIFARNKADVKFLKSPEATVYTTAKSTWKEFFNQRKRWAGKWPHYQLKYIKYIAALILIGNLSFITWLIVCALQGKGWELFVILFGLKSFTDAIFIKQVLYSYDKKIKWKYFILTALFYPFYVSFFALNSNSVRYEWKGRKL